MKKLRDLIYDYNDIFLAIIIIAVAGVILFWRVTTIMDYSGPTAQGHQETEVDLTDVDLTQKEVDDYNTNPDDIEPSGETTGGAVEGKDNTQEQTPAGTAKEVKITIPSGATSQKIADLCVKEGLAANADEFLKEVQAQGVESKLKAGTFTIPKGSTLTDIVKIISK